MKSRLPRYRIRLRCIIVVNSQNDGNKNIFYSENISLSGALVSPAFPMKEELAMNQSFSISIQLPAIDASAHELQCQGTLSRKNSGTDQAAYGIQFDFPDEHSKATLASYISKFLAEYPEALL